MQSPASRATCFETWSAKLGERRQGKWGKSMGRTIIVRLLLALLLLVIPVAAHALQAPALFTTEQQAQQHCPRDVVVWLNIPSGIYHFKRQRWYGNTKRGAYVCKKEADSAGDRATRNGQ